MNKTNIRTTEGSNQREKQDKRMIPICVLQYLIENTNCNNRATVQDISNGLDDYGVSATRDTVQKTLTDLISRKDYLIDMGFPEIKYEEIRRKNKNYVEKENETKSADEKEEKWQTMLTNFYVCRADEGNAFVSNGLNLSETEVALILNLLAPGRKDRDAFVEDLAEKLEKIGSTQKTLTNTGISALSKKQTLGAKYVSEVIKTINEAIHCKQQIKFVPRHYNQNLRLVHSNKIVIFDPYIVIGNNVIGVESGESDLKSYRIDKFHPYPERVEKGIKEGNPTDDEEVTDNELPTPVIKLKRNRFSNKSDYEIYTYLSRHPDLDESNTIRVIMDLKLDAIDVFADTFGTDFGRNDGIRLELPGEDPIPRGYCRASLWVSYSYILRWALMHADKCIILKPQALRDKIGGLSHTLAESTYLKHEEDYYRNAIIKAKEKGKLTLWENQFEERREHEKLTTIWELCLKSKLLTDISFVEKYTELRSVDISLPQVYDYSILGKLPNLQGVCLNAEEIQNLSFINMSKSIRYLCISAGDIKDVSALYKKSSLELIDLCESEIQKLDIEKIKKENPMLIIRKKSKGGYGAKGVNCEAAVDKRFDECLYPYNLIYSTHDIYHPIYNQLKQVDIPCDFYKTQSFSQMILELLQESDIITQDVVNLVFAKGYTMREAGKAIFRDVENKKQAIEIYAEYSNWIKALKEGKQAITQTDFIIDVLYNLGLKIRGHEVYKTIYEENSNKLLTGDVRKKMLKRHLDIVRGRY